MDSSATLPTAILAEPTDPYAKCRQLAQSHYENFPVGRLVPKKLRSHVHAVYAFARVADDLADELHHGRLVVGVSSAPVYGELAFGEIGVGAWLNDRPIRVSEVAEIEAAALSTGNLKTLATGPQWPAFGRLEGPILKLSLLESGRNPGRKPASRPGGTMA